MEASRGLSAGEIAALVGGELSGDSTIFVAGVAPIDRAGPGDLAFVASTRFLPSVPRSAAAVVLVAPELRGRLPGDTPHIAVRDPYRALATILEAMYRIPEPGWGIHATVSIGSRVRWKDRIAIGAGAHVGADVQFGSRCVIGAGVAIGDTVRVGDECRIGTGAVIERGTRLGHRVTVQAGARLGTSGYGYVPDDPDHTAIPHIGRCVIGDDVDIGANTTIDRGTLDDTIIGNATKIDNLVQIGHNCRVGRRCLIMAQVGLAGSTVVEDDVILAGQAGVAGHLRIGRGARVAAQGGVIGDVPEGATVSGYPARDHRRVLRQAAALGRLAPIAGRLEELVRGNAGHTA